MERINDIKRGKLANCIALHDFANPKTDLKEWVEYVTSFFEQHGLVPNRISSPSPTSGKNINFRNGIKKLESCNYRVDNIWIGSLPPEYNNDISDAIFSADILLKVKDTSCLLCFDNDIAPFDSHMIKKLVTDLANIFGSQYGYVYQRAFNLGPTWYPYGVISGLKFEDPETDLIDKWGKVYCPNGIYKTGDLRDIYPTNILCSSHINRIIDGQRFEDWIKAVSNRGVLERLGNDLWSWSVATDQITKVREALKNTGIILCI